MTLPTYTVARRREIALLLGIEEQYLYQICKGLSMASPALSRRLHDVDPLAELRDLRPDDWQIIWPEAAKKYTRSNGEVVTDQRKAMRSRG